MNKFEIKTKGIKNIVLSKYQSGDTPTEFHRDLNGGISLATIEMWCQMICQSGYIQLHGTCDGPRIVRPKENMQKLKNHLSRKQYVLAQNLSRELSISATTVRRILKIDLSSNPIKR